MSDVAHIVTAIQRFGLDIFLDEIDKENDDTNILLSPLNVTLCLMSVQYLNNSIIPAYKLTDIEARHIHKTMHMFIHMLSDGKTVKTANLLGIKEEQDLCLNPNLKDNVQGFYRVKIMDNIDFKNHPHYISAMNAWILFQTEGRIYDVVSRVLPSTVLMFVSTLHFRSDWVKPFNNSYMDHFLVDPPRSSTNSTPTKFMTQTNDFYYSTNDYCQVIKLPYQNNYSMVLFLPHKDERSLTSILSSNFIKKSLQTLQLQKVTVTLPIFKVSYTSELLDGLKRLGINNKIASDPINLFKQTTVIEVNEKTTVSLDCDDSSLIDFKVNHPFVYMIIEDTYHLCICMGCIRNPV